MGIAPILFPGGILLADLGTMNARWGLRRIRCVEKKQQSSRLVYFCMYTRASRN